MTKNSWIKFNNFIKVQNEAWTYLFISIEISVMFFLSVSFMNVEVELVVLDCINTKAIVCILMKLRT